MYRARRNLRPVGSYTSSITVQSHRFYDACGLLAQTLSHQSRLQRTQNPATINPEPTPLADLFSLHVYVHVYTYVGNDNMQRCFATSSTSMNKAVVSLTGPHASSSTSVDEDGAYMKRQTDILQSQFCKLSTCLQTYCSQSCTWGCLGISVARVAGPSVVRVRILACHIFGDRNPNPNPTAFVPNPKLQSLTLVRNPKPYRSEVRTLSR